MPVRDVTRDDVVAYLRRAARAVERHARLLDRLDAALGDGDHGENMVTGLGAVLEAMDDPGHEGGSDLDTSISGLLLHVGSVLVASVGGASGPLYGTAFIEAGFSVRGSPALDVEHLAVALEAAAAGLARRGHCARGDKTILDALEPAAAALREAAEHGADPRSGLVAAIRAAHAGMRSTTPLVARRGLALRLGERSRGHQDPGATSCFLLLRAAIPSTTMTAYGSAGQGSATVSRRP